MIAMNRLYGLLSLLSLAALYLFRRDDWIYHLCNFLSSQRLRIPEKRHVLVNALNDELYFRHNAKGEIDDLSSEQRVVDVLKFLKKISYRESQDAKISGKSASELVEIYQRLSDTELGPLHSIINRILFEQLSPEIIVQQAFSQEGEDLILSRLLRDRTGFFVDVSAHHPTRFSNTYKLYLRGWRGINIDPLPGGMRLFDEARAEDINLELPISSGEPNETVRYYTFDEPAFNSLDKRNIADAESAGAKLTGEIEVKCVSLSQRLEEKQSNFKNIELLTIDAEHRDFNILQSFPFEKYQPEIIVVEVKELDLGSPKGNPVYDYLSDRSYTLRSYLYHSAIFTRI
jgi:hypothetical protein